VKHLSLESLRICYCKKITTETKKLVQKSALVTAITSIGNPVLITMGAGDIGKEVEPLTKNLIYA
jgi:UDP-N-acetylmuramate--alanine ligase